MNYLHFISTNKGSFLLLLLINAALVFYLNRLLITISNDQVVNAVILFTLSLVFYLEDYYRFLRHKKIVVWIQKNSSKGALISTKGTITNSRLLALPFSMRSEYPVRLPAYEEPMFFYSDENVIVILSYYKEFGLIRRHLPPIVISKKEAICTPVGKAITSSKVDISKIEDSLLFSFLFGYKGVKEICISTPPNVDL